MNNDTQKTINQKELETLAFWQENNIFEKTLETPAGEAPKGNFSFYDGPPFATGVPHHGHLLAGTIKDAIPRYQTMKGNYVRRVWGWDCHGLPLENLVEKKLELKNKDDIEKLGIKTFNETARSMVFEYEALWKQVVPRMGRFIDMEHSYKTMDSTYTESIWWSFKTLYEKGLIYEGHKVMHICPRCATTLAQSEVNMPGSYRDITDISVTVPFELEDEPNTFVLAWTTTPWTLPGNTALAVNRNIEYVKLREFTKLDGGNGDGTYNTSDGKTIIISKNILSSDSRWTQGEHRKEVYYYQDSTTNTTGYELIDSFYGDKLEGLTYKQLFPYFKDTPLKDKENIYKIWHADFITDDAGTGIAHEAPAFGAEDYELARENRIPLIKHVELNGSFTKEVLDFPGLVVKKAGDSQSADIEIIKWLAHKGKLFSKQKIVHSYPHCWRCDTPLLNYATSSWFMDIGKIKNKLISENNGIGWVPDHIRDGRFGKWLEGARDWALSRARYWGAPLPVWKCTDCSHSEIFGSVDDLQKHLTSSNSYYVMRHGESLSNTEDSADSGKRVDNHLTERGIQEVKESAGQLKEIGFDYIITSPILRAKETAHLVAETIGLPTSSVLEDERLKEFDFGDLDGKSFDSIWEDLRPLHYDFDKKVSGGEGYRDIQKRTLAALFDAEEKYTNKKILFVTHGSPMWALISAAHHLSDSEALAYRQQKKEETGGRYFLRNAGFEKLEFKPFPHSEFGLDFHRPYIDEIVFSCPSTGCAGTMKRIPDVFDCWYESGSMPFAQLHYPFENKELFEKSFPADFIAEGLDQTRGWFYSLLNLSVGLFDKSSYKHVIVNGLTMAADGEKMSKSKKNYTDPMVLIEKYGADAFRYSLLSSPLMRGENIPFPDSLVDEVYKKLVMRLENVVSFYKMYEDKNVEIHAESRDILDTWILSLLDKLVLDTTSAMEKYELDNATRPFESFIDDLSTWYVRRSRERLKGEEGEEVRKNSLATLGYVLDVLSKTLAPFMPFMAERIYRDVSPICESVHLE
jgi:isoleucyl-tRNA synthetase